MASSTESQSRGRGLPFSSQSLRVPASVFPSSFVFALAHATRALTSEHTHASSEQSSRPTVGCGDRKQKNCASMGFECGGFAIARRNEQQRIWGEGELRMGVGMVGAEICGAPVSACCWVEGRVMVVAAILLEKKSCCGNDNPSFIGMTYERV